jgi:NTE family protein
MSEAFPGTYFPILTGISAGAINAAHLGNHTGSFPEATAHLADSWSGLELEHIVEVESGFSMLWNLLRQQAPETETLTSADVRSTHGLLDTTPLWNYLRDRLEAPDGELTGVQRNLDAGRLQALAVIATNYATGQTVTWIEGEEFDRWERPDRVSVQTDLTVNHVMASTAIPLVFPAVRVGDTWYGDGSIRLSAPLAPAVHLGADRILGISNRYPRSRSEADEPAVQGYPPAAQIIGILMNSVFVDALDRDATTLKRVNKLVDELPPQKRHGMRPVDFLQLRPSVDLGRLARDYEEEIPSAFRFLTSGLGTRETESPDWLSVLLFEPRYIDRLLDIGYNDARRQHDRIAHFLAGNAAESAPPPWSSNSEGTTPAE